MKPIVYDTETTGTDHLHDQIIEAAWLNLPATIDEFMAVKNPAKFANYCQRFRPSVSISYGAMSTHHILGDELDGMPSSTLVEIPAATTHIIGHKVDFDCDMTNGSATGVPDTVRRICTLALCRWAFPEMDSHSQGAMIYFIGHQIDNPAWARDLVKGEHAALDDVIMCAILLRYLIHTIRQRGFDVDTWDQLADLSDEARIPRKMTFGKHVGERIEDVPSSYAKWYASQSETDPYYILAFKRAGKI